MTTSKDMHNGINNVPTCTDETSHVGVDNITTGEKMITRKDIGVSVNKKYKLKKGKPRIKLSKAQKEKIKERNRKSQKAFRDRQREIDEANEKKLDRLMSNTKYLIDKIKSNWKEIADKKIIEK